MSKFVIQLPARFGGAVHPLTPRGYAAAYRDVVGGLPAPVRWAVGAATGRLLADKMAAADAAYRARATADR